MPRLKITRLTAAVLAAMLAVLAYGGVHFFRPFLDTRHTLAAGVPAPPAFYGIYRVGVPAHASACMTTVTFDPAGDLVAFTDVRNPRRPASVVVTASAPGYSASSQVPHGGPGPTAQLVALTPPRRPVIGTLCVRDDGPTPMELYGTNEARSLSRPVLTVGSTPVAANFAVSFYAGKRQSYRERLHAIVAHASTFRPWFERGALLWILLVLVVVGVPLGVIAALLMSLRSESPTTTSLP